MNKELNINNSKKLIIGISILFCAIILIIGATTAYFTQSDSEDIDDIVSTNQVTLDYQDNDEFMLGDLIPIDEDKVEYAYNREDDLKCKDDKGYNVCSIYQFTITNTGNVIQDIIIDLYPKVNGFTNLKFNLYNIITNEREIANKELILNSETPITLVNDLKLNTTNNKSNTYELVFYIKNDPNNDQSPLDANKSFGANIKVNSVTTGKYHLEQIGDPGCWLTREDDPTVLETFLGINEDGTINESCSNYVKVVETIDNQNYYEIISVPSNVGGQPITTLGNELFNAAILNEDGEILDVNKYHNIKKITVEDGIKEIEDLSYEKLSGAFIGIGALIENEDYNLEINLPDSITKIGDSAFYLSAPLKEIKLPSNLEIIGDGAFSETHLNSITIPKNVTSIGEFAFSYISLTKLEFEDSDNLSENQKLLTIGESAFKHADIENLTIPARVKEIGNEAFYETYQLTKVTFMGASIDPKDNKSNLTTIGESAFFYSGLTYSLDDPLLLPTSITSLGYGAFYQCSSLEAIRYNGPYTGTDWYWPENTTLNP